MAAGGGSVGIAGVTQGEDSDLEALQADLGLGTCSKGRLPGITQERGWSSGVGSCLCFAALICHLLPTLDSETDTSIKMQCQQGGTWHENQSPSPHFSVDVSCLSGELGSPDGPLLSCSALS